MAKNKKAFTINLEPKAFDIINNLAKEQEVSMTLVTNALIYSFRESDVIIEIAKLKKTFNDKPGPKSKTKN